MELKSTTRNDLILQACMIVIALVLYHHFFGKSHSQKIYTTNARTILESNYSKAMRGEIDKAAFEKILTNMETQLQEVVTKDPQAVILVKKAIVMGTDPIMFSPDGNIIKDPEKIQEALKQEKEVLGNKRENTSYQQLERALREFQEDYSKMQGTPK